MTDETELEPAQSSAGEQPEDEWYDLLPIEKKLISFSLGLGILLLVVFIFVFKFAK